jgi:hypothetical protein
MKVFMIHPDVKMYWQCPDPEFEDQEELSVRKTRKRGSGAKEMAADVQGNANGQRTLTLDERQDANRQPGAMSKDDDPKLAALLEESAPSESEYKGDSVPEESDQEPKAELKNDEPDTRIKLRAGKKQKKGLIARDQISAAAMVSDDPFVDAPVKRVNSNQTQGWDFPIWSFTTLILI